MGLSQSLYTGYSGLHTHQKSMDNIGNNLANVNTVGYKKSDFMFNNLFKQALNTGGIPADGARSALNPKSVGMGVTTGAILNNFTQGTPEQTNNPLDCAISGNGFFMVNTGGGMALTRNGSFYIDNAVGAGQRMLCVGDGLPVQGWLPRDGVITPSNTVQNITLPSIGDLLPGKITGDVNLTGILPTNTSGAEFNGRSSTNLELNGNLTGDGQVLETSIFAEVTQAGDDSAEKAIQEVKVRVEFHGPTTSPDGTTNTYTWTMTTVDWPEAGDPGVQIYPAADDDEFTQGDMNFWANGNASRNRGAGQAMSEKVSPGSSKVSTSKTDADGNTVTSSFAMPANFSLDISRLTHLADSPTGNEVSTWHVDGNPAGTMARTVTIYDEYTSFQSVNGVMTPVRVAEARENTLYFSKTGSDNAGTDWSWSASADGATGTLRFDTHGELASQQQSGGRINYSFDDIQNIAHDGQIQAASQDGYRDGTLGDVSIDGNGVIWGHYSNDVVQPLAQIAMGTVPNTSGLNGSSGTLFYPGIASGQIMIGVVGDSTGTSPLPPIGAGSIMANHLESSNVDLSREFTSMIQTQRGYQFNGRTITTSDEMLQTALQLKR